MTIDSETLWSGVFNGSSTKVQYVDGNILSTIETEGFYVITSLDKTKGTYTIEFKYETFVFTGIGIALLQNKKRILTCVNINDNVYLEFETCDKDVNKFQAIIKEAGPLTLEKSPYVVYGKFCRIIL